MEILYYIDGLYIKGSVVCVFKKILTDDIRAANFSLHSNPRRKLQLGNPLTCCFNATCAASITCGSTPPSSGSPD